jgi:Phytanoyl-CoA dioxygenase (PhyH)
MGILTKIEKVLEHAGLTARVLHRQPSGMLHSDAELEQQRRDANARDRSLTLSHFTSQVLTSWPEKIEGLESFRAESFPESDAVPWLDRSDAEAQVAARLGQGLLSAAEAESCRQWCRNGFLALSSPVEPELLDRAWASYEAALNAGRVSADPGDGDKDPYPGRCLNPHTQVPEVSALLHHPAVMRWAKLLLDREPIPFQTLAFTTGSQQLAHSDSIHMTTYPLGYLVGAWIACEDINPDAGPLLYYPGSHRLAYVFSKDVGIAPGDHKTKGHQGTYNALYEPAIQKLIREHGLRPISFEARKGDVLFWHANLFHGGLPRKDLALTRKSIVCHYFFQGVVCYHDLYESLAPLPEALGR